MADTIIQIGNRELRIDLYRSIYHDCSDCEQGRIFLFSAKLIPNMPYGGSERVLLKDGKTPFYIVTAFDGNNTEIIEDTELSYAELADVANQSGVSYFMLVRRAMEIAVIPKGMLPPMGTGPLDESLVRELFGEKTDVQGSTPCAKKQEPEIQITGYPGKVVTELPKIVKKEPSASEYAKNGWIRTESGQIRIKEEPKPDMKLVIDTALPLLLRCDKAGLENDHLGCEDVQGPYWNIEDETGLEWYKADRNADISEVLESLISMLDWMKGNAVNELYFVAPRYSIGVHFRTAEKYILFWNIDKIDHKKKNELRMIIRRSGHNIMLYNRYFRRDLLTGDEYIYEGGRRMLDVDVYEYCIRKIKRVVLL